MKRAMLIAATCAVIVGCDSKVPTQATATPAPTGWKSYKHTDKFDDSVSHIAEVPARHAEGAGAERPVLVAICNGKTTKALIDWKSYVGMDGVSVQSRLDQATARIEESRTTSDGRATYMPDAAPKLKEFLGAATFIASVEPVGGGRIYAEFDISGADAALQEIRRTCNW